MEKYVSITRFDKDKNYAIVAKGKGINRRYNFVNKSENNKMPAKAP